MSLDREVQMSEPILRDRVSSTLHDTGIGAVRPHDGIHHFFEELEVGDIVDALLQGYIHREIFADALTY